ncbi:MAG TPA: glycosyltransferase family 2 protein, partial [Bacteroidia bacterium]|nr:glycosyltransferase family 2 protein [Bacteroidia bacterium]
NFRNNLAAITKNYPNMLWIWVIVIRLFLDGIAGIKFFLEGKPLHTLAIVRAHFAYYFFLPRLLNKRSKMKKHKNYCSNFKQFYMRSIVADHFIHKIKVFSQLDKSRFN